MERDAVLAILRAHEAELRAAGVTRLSLFGSVARGDDGPGSDVDVLVRLDDEAVQSGFAYFGQLEALSERLASIVGRKVDVVTEPVRRADLRRVIAEEGVAAF